MDIEELRSRMSPDVQCYAERIMDMYNAPFARFLGIDIVSVTADSAAEFRRRTAEPPFPLGGVCDFVDAYRL